MYSASLEKVNASNILAILAVSGIETVLPKIYTEDIDVIEEIKLKHKDEREDYITFLREFINKCHLGLKSVANSDNKLIKDTATNLAGKSVSIAQSVLSGNLTAAGWSVLKALLNSIKGGTERSNLVDKLPMVSYAYKIKEKI